MPQIRVQISFSTRASQKGVTDEKFLENREKLKNLLDELDRSEIIQRWVILPIPYHTQENGS